MIPAFEACLPCSDVINSTTAPSSHTPAYLGEVVVHARDIRQPLGLVRTPSVGALTPVAGAVAEHIVDLVLAGIMAPQALA